MITGLQGEQCHGDVVAACIISLRYNTKREFQDSDVSLTRHAIGILNVAPAGPSHRLFTDGSHQTTFVVSGDDKVGANTSQNGGCKKHSGERVCGHVDLHSTFLWLASHKLQFGPLVQSAEFPIKWGVVAWPLLNISFWWSPSFLWHHNFSQKDSPDLCPSARTWEPWQLWTRMSMSIVGTHVARLNDRQPVWSPTFCIWTMALCPPFCSVLLSSIGEKRESTASAPHTIGRKREFRRTTKMVNLWPAKCQFVDFRCNHSLVWLTKFKYAHVVWARMHTL